MFLSALKLPHLLIGITERYAVGCQTVNLLDAEHWVVHRIVEDMLVHFYLVDDIGCHLQTVFQFAKGWQKDFLDDLQVAEVAHGQVIHDERHLLRQRLELVALGTDELEDIGILLVGHDRRACGTLFRQLHKREVLRVEQTGIKSHFGDGTCDGGDGEAYVALHLASPHLGIDHIVVHRVEAQQFRCHRAVQGEG